MTILTSSILIPTLSCQYPEGIIHTLLMYEIQMALSSKVSNQFLILKPLQKLAFPCCSPYNPINNNKKPKGI